MTQRRWLALIVSGLALISFAAFWLRDWHPVYGVLFGASAGVSYLMWMICWKWDL